MIFQYIHTSGVREDIEVSSKTNITKSWLYLKASNKLEFLKKFIPAYLNGQKIILFDNNHKQLLEFYQENNINDIADIKEVNQDSKLLFFTSGSTGFPVGAFKSKENIDREVEALSKLIYKYNLKKVIVTVPFIHIYGILAGLLLPLSLHIKIIIKEDFLPYELLKEAKDKYTLIITTPVFIKALIKLSSEQDMSSNLFICSTGLLQNIDTEKFEIKYKTHLLQLFGSTETGGIAYKFHTTSIWTPLSNVEIQSKKNKLLVKSAFISKFLLNKVIEHTNKYFQTEDIIYLKNQGFVLLGRSSKLIKIAGKRISTSQIEYIIESIEYVKKAVVELVYKQELLRSEQIIITIESEKKISKVQIKNTIFNYYGTLTIPFHVVYVDKINYSAMGKKIIFNK
jgi:acyl-coenzyme A synthetase/AMP-(fatty) acid ligase